MKGIEVIQYLFPNKFKTQFIKGNIDYSCNSSCSTQELSTWDFREVNSLGIADMEA